MKMDADAAPTPAGNPPVPSTVSTIPFGSQGYNLWSYQGGFGFNTSASDLTGIENSGLPQRWYHVTAVFNHGTAAANNKLYIDGIPQALLQRSRGGYNFDWANIGSVMAIGGPGGVDSSRFMGFIDDVAIYDGELPIDRIQAHYQTVYPNLPTTGSTVIRLAANAYRTELADWKLVSYPPNCKQPAVITSSRTNLVAVNQPASSSFPSEQVYTRASATGESGFSFGITFIARSTAKADTAITTDYQVRCGK